jgi:uncharacterized protein (DUF736 family)
MTKTTQVGVAWRKETPDGKVFFSVIITNPIGPDFNYTLWPVEQKRGDNSPDFSVTKQSDAAKREAASRQSESRPVYNREPGDEFPDEG